MKEQKPNVKYEKERNLSKKEREEIYPLIFEKERNLSEKEREEYSELLTQEFIRRLTHGSY